jgi:methanogenic corrinoid protein MtbC1
MGDPGMEAEILVLTPEGLRRFRILERNAITAVTERIFAAPDSIYARVGPDAQEDCQDDLAFHLEFLRPVLEFGLMQPMVDYLVWFAKVLEARGIPSSQLALSLDWLGEFFAAHMDAADGVIVAGALQRVRRGYETAEKRPTAAPMSLQPWAETEAFESAILGGRQHEALALFNRCFDDGKGLIDIETNLVQPALYEVGMKWQSNQISVAQEHLATAIAQSVITVGLLRSPVGPMNGKRVLLACVQGNRHALGIRMVRDAFQLAGWDVQLLGADTPTASLVGHAVEWRPDLIGLSVSFPQQIRAAKDVIEQLRQQLGGACPPVMVGGLAINRFARLAQLVGADAYCTDPQEAVMYANRAVGIGEPHALVSA